MLTMEEAMKQSDMRFAAGEIVKGTVIEVNISELGLVTQGGKVIWGKRCYRLKM